MEFTLKIELGNAAFGDDCSEEVARILEDAAKRVRNGCCGGGLKDTNGNTVGDFSFTGGE